MSKFNMLALGKPRVRAALASTLAATLALAGCATQPEAPPPATKPSPPPVTTAAPTPTPVPTALPTPAAPVSTEASVLKEGIALYNNGEFAKAIKRLKDASEIWGPGGSKAGQLEARKYMAFSYCVTRQQKQCFEEFDKALKQDPAFDLAPGEKGHPLWTPAFLRAQKANKKPGK